MEESPTSQPTTEELLNRFGVLLKEYEERVNTFAGAVDTHVRAREQDPLFAALDGLLQEHKKRLDEFGAGLQSGLARLDQELEATLGKCREMLANVEGTKHNLTQAIAGITTNLQTDTQLNLVDKAGVLDDLGDAAHSLARVVSEWFATAKACQDLLYTRLEKQEDLLHSDEKLVASFTILLKMREELVHARLEKHEAFLKSAEDLLKSTEDLLGVYLGLIKEATSTTASG